VTDLDIGGLRDAFEKCLHETNSAKTVVVPAGPEPDRAELYKRRKD
jgi:hypothetical protein